MIAIGRIEVKTREMASRTMNLSKLKIPPSYERIAQIIKNKGIVIIGGWVNVETAFAKLVLSMR